MADLVLRHSHAHRLNGDILGRGHRRPPGSSTDSDVEKKSKGKKKKSKTNKTIIAEDTAG